MPCQNEEDKQDDKVQTQNTFNDMRLFFQTFTSKLQVFDPLDRPIFGNGEEDQAIKRNELLDKIIKMPLVEASKLQLPISNRCLVVLQNLFKVMQDSCNKEAKRCIKIAKEGSPKE